MDEETRLGIDASQAFATLRKLQQEFSRYAKGVNSAADASDDFNSSASKTDDILNTLAKVSGVAARAMLKLAKAKREAVQASIDLTNQERKEAAARKAAAELDRKRVATKSVKNLVGNITPGNRAKATLPEIVNFDKAVDSFRNVVASSKLSEKDIKKILGNLGASYTGMARKVRDAAAQVVAANAKLGGKNLAGVARILKQVGDEADKANPKLKGFQLNLSSIANFTIASLISRGIQELGSAFVQGAKDAKEFEFRLAEILTIANGSFGGGLDQVADIVTRLSGEFGQPGIDVAAGLYEVLSNNIKGAGESTLVLTESLKFSRAALATTKDSVQTLTGVLNSYGLTASSTTRISDILFKTIDLGRVTGEELANTIGRVLPLAATLGVKFEEVAASLATLTIQGVNAADAETQLTNIFLKLIRPTEALQERYDQMGIASAEAGIAAFGFQGFLIELTKTTGTTASEIGELFNQIRGTRGVLGQVSTGAKLYADNLRKIQDESAGAADAASKLIRETNAGVIQAELEKIRNFLVNDFGRSALTVLAAIIRNVAGAKVAVTLLTASLAAMTATGAIIFLAALKVSFVQLGIAAAAANIGVGALALSIGSIALLTAPVALVAGYLLLKNSFNEGREAHERFMRQTQKEAEEARKNLRPVVEARKKNAQEQVGIVVKQLLDLQKAYNSDRANATKAQEGITDSFKRQLSKRQSLIDQFVDGIADIQNQTAKNIEGLNKEFASFEFGIKQGQFDRALEGLDPRQQGNLLRKRIEDILGQAREAARQGNAELSAELFNEAANLGGRFASLTGQRAAGEQTVNRILAERRSINAELVRQEQAKAREAQKIEEEQQQIAEGIRRQIEEFNQLQQSTEKALGAGESLDSPALAKDLDRLKQLSLDIPKNLKGLSLGNLKGVTDLQNLLRQIQQPFVSPTSRQTVPLSFAVDESIRDVLTRLTESTKRAPPELFVKVKTITGTDLDIFDPAQAQKDATRVGQALQKGIENSISAPDLEKVLFDARSKISQARQNLIKDADLNFKRGTLSKVSPLRLFGLAPDGSLIDAEAASAGFQKSINSLINRAMRGVEEGTDVTGFLAQLRAGLAAANEDASTIAPGARQAGITAQNLANIIDGIEELAAARAKLTASDEQAAAARTLEDALLGKVGNVKAALDLLKPAATASLDGVQSSFDGVSTKKARDEVDALITKINSVPPLPSGTPSANTLGGFPRFGLGGVGVDNQLALLNRREFVVNAESTRRFKAELISMNAGRRPSNFATGGAVSNTTFGDININVDGKRTQDVSARRLANQFKREVRRRTSRI